MSSDAITKNMHPIRRLLWPILKSEHSKFIPMLLIYALIVFNYSLLKTTKDALIVTAQGSGAATLSFIKVWVILPMALVSTLIFTRLSNKLSREKVFEIMITGFLVFFFIFAFILYPLNTKLHPHHFADWCQSYLPKGCMGLIAIFRNWTFTLYYVMCELWGTMIMSVLFYGFANDVTTKIEAKRFYAILGIGANLATTLAGQAGVLTSGTLIHTLIGGNYDRWTISLMTITTIVIFTGGVILLLFKRLSRSCHATQINDEDDQTKQKKPQMGLRKNFAYLAKSKYLVCIAILVLSFNSALTLIEILWKDQVHQLYPYTADYSAYMSSVMSYIGILSTIFSVFLCGQVVRKFGWTFSAYITPVVLLFSGLLFFTFYLGRSSHRVIDIAATLGTTPLVIITFLGSFQNCFSRASKFTFFDVTKEMSFIPLSAECKLKGKAAIDGVGSRLGKSGASVFHQGLLMFFGTVALSAPFVGLLVVLIFIGWLYAVNSLGKQFDAHHANDEMFTNPNAKEERPTEKAKPAGKAI